MTHDAKIQKELRKNKLKHQFVTLSFLDLVFGNKDKNIIYFVQMLLNLDYALGLYSNSQLFQTWCFS